ELTVYTDNRSRGLLVAGRANRSILQSHEDLTLELVQRDCPSRIQAVHRLLYLSPVRVMR
ncbi:hypothetical protein PMAYCL1PPCAC_04067, partial [Pristionchus mayeri]